MTEDPYRWLEAIANRREYIRTQLKGGSPLLAVSLPEGILLFGIGTGQSKVFEIFDRQGLAGLGHPADLERIRQAIIDAAHLEGFTRAPEDVTLRRLVSQGLGPQLKAAFEQIFAPPFLVRLLLAEVHARPSEDVLIKLGFDGSFTHQPGGIAVVTDDAEKEAQAETRLRAALPVDASIPVAAAALLREWHQLQAGPADNPGSPAVDIDTILAGIPSRVVEAALLRRTHTHPARYQPLDARQLGFPTRPPA